MIHKIKSLFSRLNVFIIGGLLGAFGGQGYKWIRRIGIPLLIFIIAYIRLNNLWLFSTLIMIFPFYLGYGIPEIYYDYLSNGDEIAEVIDKGSFLGRFFYKLTNQNHKLADILTRGSISILFVLSLISIPLIKHNWGVYILYSMGIVLTNSLLSWRGMGEFLLFGKRLLIVDILTWGLITLFASIIIYY